MRILTIALTLAGCGMSRIDATRMGVASLAGCAGALAIAQARAPVDGHDAADAATVALAGGLCLAAGLAAGAQYWIDVCTPETEPESCAR